MQRLSLKFFKILIGRFNNSRWYANCNRIIRNIMGNNGACSNHNFIADRNTWQNNDIISKIYIVTNFYRLCNFQVWNLFPKQQSAAIMRDKFYAIGYMNIFSKRNDPRLGTPSYTPINFNSSLHIHSDFLSVFYRIPFAYNYPINLSIQFP